MLGCHIRTFFVMAHQPLDASADRGMQLIQELISSHGIDLVMEFCASLAGTNRIEIIREGKLFVQGAAQLRKRFTGMPLSRKLESH